MAIQINQKTESRKSSLLFKFFMILGILFLILAGSSYFYLDRLNGNLEKENQSIDDAIKQKRTFEINDLEKEISVWDQKIKDYNIVFGSHGAPSNIFAFLEKATHPKVWWTNLSFEGISPSTLNLVNLEGTADSSVSLQQQILIFEQESVINRVNLSRLVLLKDGSVDFNLEVVFNSGTLNPKVEIINQ